MKIKIFRESMYIGTESPKVTPEEVLEKQVNSFTEDKEVISIQTATYDAYVDGQSDPWVVITVVYK